MLNVSDARQLSIKYRSQACLVAAWPTSLSCHPPARPGRPAPLVLALRALLIPDCCLLLEKCPAGLLVLLQASLFLLSHCWPLCRCQ